MGADIERKRKGLPTWGLLALVIGLGFLLVMLSRGAGHIFGGLLTGGVIKTASAVTTNMMPREKRGTFVSNTVVAPSFVTPRNNPITEADFEITGWVKWPDGREWVLLSDGRTVKRGDWNVQALDKEHGLAMVDGKLVKWQKKGIKDEYQEPMAIRQRRYNGLGAGF